MVTPHRFEFATTSRIIFGAGTIRELPQLVLGLSRRAFVVANGEGMRAAPTVATLQAAGTAREVRGVAGEPTVGTGRAAN